MSENSSVGETGASCNTEMQVVTGDLERKRLMQMIPHDGNMFSITFKHVTCKITRIRVRPCASEIRHVEEKQLLFETFFIHASWAFLDL